MMETEDVRRLMADGRMLRSEERNGRDTTMCGDPKSWSPVKVIEPSVIYEGKDGEDGSETYEG